MSTTPAQPSAKQSSCFHVHALLNKTPSIPCVQSVPDIADYTLGLEGFAEWNISSQSGCSLDSSTKQSRSQRAVIGIEEPNFCKLGAAPATNEPDPCFPANFLAVLSFGWSYILSSKLCELRGKTAADRVSYTDTKATVRKRASMATKNSFPVYMPDDISSVELRWWTAILATGCGWQSVLHRSEDEYHSPWACHLGPEDCFELIVSSKHMDFESCQPPSSSEALQYLESFAERNNVYHELLAGLSISLFLHPSNRYGTHIVLPHPWNQFLAPSKSPSNIQKLDPSHIAHYMALSCMPNILASSMIGCFWEPGVECYLAGEWLSPVQKILSLEAEDHPQLLVKMMVLRNPATAPIWLGAAMTGLIPKLLEVFREDAPLSLAATVWTQSQQSFMNPQYFRTPKTYGNTQEGLRMYRADELRLLYITDVDLRCYASPPLSPWPPFGTVQVKSAALAVQLHLRCAHQLNNKQWNWKSEDGENVIDLGAEVIASCPRGIRLGKSVRLAAWFQSKMYLLETFLRGSKTTEQEQATCRSLSRLATRLIFSWSLADGIKPSDLDLYKDPWLKDILQDS